MFSKGMSYMLRQHPGNKLHWIKPLIFLKILHYSCLSWKFPEIGLLASFAFFCLPIRNHHSTKYFLQSPCNDFHILHLVSKYPNYYLTYLGLASSYLLLLELCGKLCQKKSIPMFWKKHISKLLKSYKPLGKRQTTQN